MSSIETKDPTDELEHAYALASVTEESERIADSLDWPEAVFCGGQPNTTLTEAGASLVRGMLPSLRERAMIARELKYTLPGKHREYEVAGRVADALMAALSTLEALSSEARGKEDGPPDAEYLHSAWVSVRKADREATRHLEERRKELAGV